MNRPTHEYFYYFKKINLFKNINSFKEFETKIENLPSIDGLTKNLTMGHAMELFVEGYLNISKFAASKKVWPQGHVPKNILKLLNLNPNDKGYDGVYLDRLNNYHIYQVKFRSNRHQLSWSELSNFIGVSEKSKTRLLLCNSNKIADEFCNKERVRLIRGIDFDNLDKFFFNKIRNWIEQKKNIITPQWALDPYQIETRKKNIKRV